MDCLFCRIINKEIPSTIVYEDDFCVAFNDIHPKAKTHILIVPRKHIDSVMTLEDTDAKIAGEMMVAARRIGEMKKLEGYHIKCHVGEKGGQEIMHIHLHLLSDQ